MIMKNITCVYFQVEYNNLFSVPQFGERQEGSYICIYLLDIIYFGAKIQRTLRTFPNTTS